MRKVICIILCLFLISSCSLVVHAANDVPEEVMAASRSVVRIQAEYSKGSVTGSGFVIKNEPGDVLVVTNHHVVEGKPHSISIWVGEDQTVGAEILLTSPERDLCVLQVTEYVSMRPLQLAQEEARQGEAIYAVGFPGVADIFSDTEAHTSEAATITDGIISAVRSLTLIDGGNPVKLLQINADINSGNSGGPLFNAQGQVIGVNTYGISNAQGVFGAIEIRELSFLLKENYISLSDGSGQEIPAISEDYVQNVPAAALFGIAGGLSILILLVVFAGPKLKIALSAQTLRSYMAKHPNGLDLHTAVSMLLPIAVQLRDLHNNGKLHLQVSPDTIVFTAKGAALKAPSSKESDRYCNGFAAPEIYEGGNIGISSDIYSLCAVLLYAVTGNVPTNSLKYGELLTDFALCDHIRPDFLSVLKDGMDYHPQRRFGSMQMLIYEITPYNTASFQPSPAEKTRSKWIPVIACAAVCVILGTAGLVNPVFVPMVNYSKAASFMKDGEYQSALAVFQALGDYRDSQKQAQDCELAIREETYNQAVRLMETKDYDEAITLFSRIPGYRDADTLRKECAEAQVLEKAKRNFAGKWIWTNPGRINPYDQYYEIDFDAMTITFYFKSSTTEFTRVYTFEIDSANVLCATGFRDAGTVYIHYLGSELFLEYPSGSHAPSSKEEDLHLQRK